MTTHVPGRLLAGVLTLAACDGSMPVVPSNDPPRAMVSDAVAAAVSATPGASVLVDGVAYVSLVPGTFPGAVHATISNRGTGAGVTAGMFEGGLDPVPVAATAGDTLDFTIQADGTDPLRFEQTVPLTMLPIVVRTQPAGGKRDVPLNLRVLIVFSEPMSRATVTGTSVALQREGASVEASVTLSANGLEATLAPAEDVLPATEYTIVVTGSVRDAAGNPLASPTSAKFTTASPSSVGDGGIEVEVVVTGSDASGGYEARLDGSRAFPSLFLSSSATSRFTYLGNVPAGDHFVELTVPVNCSADPGALAAEVRPARLTRVRFTVTCVPLVAAVRITTPTVGPGPEAYRVLRGTMGYWDYGAPTGYDHFAYLAPNDTLTRELGISQGGGEWWQYFLLMDVPANCSVQVANPLGDLELVFGDTLEVNFPVTCSPEP